MNVGLVNEVPGVKDFQVYLFEILQNIEQEIVQLKNQLQARVELLQIST